jgi:hypothetical protein
VNGPLHVAPQLIPAGLLVTVPVPAPDFVIASVFGGSALNVAVQLRFTDIVTLPSLQSESPVQPPKADPSTGVAVSATTCPAVKGALQVAPNQFQPGYSLQFRNHY